MWSMTYSKTKSCRQSDVLNVPRHSFRQVHKEISVHVKNIRRFKPYSKTKTWRHSYVVNVPHHSNMNCSCRRDYVVHDIFKENNRVTKLCGKCTTSQFPTRK